MDKAKLEELLETMVRSNAQSLHIHPGHAPWVRVQNNVVTSSVAAPTPAAIEELTREFLFADHRERLRDTGRVEVLFASRGGVRFRVAVMAEERGLGVVFRRVSSEAPTFESLCLPELVGSFTSFHSGLVFVTGFFGAGKSATLAAMIERINRETARHVVTIEEPIEFVFPQREALVHQREVGTHVDCAAQGVLQAVRQGAEVIMVGEIRDAATLDACMAASERGCLVLATLDASGVVGAIGMLTSFYAADDRGRARARLAQNLRVLVGQMLLPRAHRKGRVPLLEILVGNRAVQRAIRAGDVGALPELMKRGRGLGMQTVDDGLRSLLKRGLITWEEAAFHAVDRDWLSARFVAKAPTS